MIYKILGKSCIVVKTRYGNRCERCHFHNNCWWNQSEIKCRDRIKSIYKYFKEVKSIKLRKLLEKINND